MDTNNTTQLLSSFLHRLADDVGNNRLDALALQSVGEFYMSYLFSEQVRNDNKPVRKGRRRARARKTRCTFRVRNEVPPGREDAQGQDDSLDSADLQKFVCLGWYIYNKILKDETV
jgi:hypothetical protein